MISHALIFSKGLKEAYMGCAILQFSNPFMPEYYSNVDLHASKPKPLTFTLSHENKKQCDCFCHIFEN